MAVFKSVGVETPEGTHTYSLNVLKKNCRGYKGTTGKKRPRKADLVLDVQEAPNSMLANLKHDIEYLTNDDDEIVTGFQSKVVPKMPASKHVSQTKHPGKKILKRSPGNNAMEKPCNNSKTTLKPEPQPEQVPEPQPQPKPGLQQRVYIDLEKEFGDEAHADEEQTIIHHYVDNPMDDILKIIEGDPKDDHGNQGTSISSKTDETIAAAVSEVFDTSDIPEEFPKPYYNVNKYKRLLPEQYLDDDLVNNMIAGMILYHGQEGCISFVNSLESQLLLSDRKPLIRIMRCAEQGDKL